jgi:hypothetical protein
MSAAAAKFHGLTRTEVPIEVSAEIRDFVQQSFAKLHTTATLECPLCPDQSASFPDVQPILKHLVLGHKLVISNINTVADIPMCVICLWQECFFGHL